MPTTAFFCLLVTGSAAFAQNTVRGKVANAAGDPIVGASVVVKGKTTGTATDIDAKF